MAAPLTRATESTPSNQTPLRVHFPLLMRSETVLSPSLNAWTSKAIKTATPSLLSIVNATPSAKPSKKTWPPMASAPSPPATFAEC